MSWGPWQILIVLLIVILLFGTKKLRSLGSDLGTAIKSFKRSMGNEERSDEDEARAPADKQDQ